MKKVLLVLMLLLTFCTSAFASVDIVINNILTKGIPQEDVQNYQFVDMFSSNPATLVISRNGKKQTIR